MSKQRYEFLARFDEKTGELKGAHFLATPGGDAVPVKLADLPAEFKIIDKAALVALDTVKAELASVTQESASKIAKLEQMVMDTQGAADTAVKSSQDAVKAMEEKVALLEATLKEHQGIADQITDAAEAIIGNEHASDTEKVEAIRIILPQAKLFGNARKRAQLEAEAAAIAAALNNL
jgi:uncharacterized protein (DUF342 family)